jgi:hypothetical protein
VLVHKRENVCFYLPEGLVILKWYNVSINVLSRGGAGFVVLVHKRENVLPEGVEILKWYNVSMNVWSMILEP